MINPFYHFVTLKNYQILIHLDKRMNELGESNNIVYPAHGMEMQLSLAGLMIVQLRVK